VTAEEGFCPGTEYPSIRKCQQVTGMDEIGGTCGTHGGGKKGNHNLFPEPEGKRPLERRRRRWEDNIKTDLKGTGCECANTAMDTLVPCLEKLSGH
jgi:hypothetical protein